RIFHSRDAGDRAQRRQGDRVPRSILSHARSQPELRPDPSGAAPLPGRSPRPASRRKESAPMTRRFLPTPGLDLRIDPAESPDVLSFVDRADVDFQDLDAAEVHAATAEFGPLATSAG